MAVPTSRPAVSVYTSPTSHRIHFQPDTTSSNPQQDSDYEQDNIADSHDHDSTNKEHHHPLPEELDAQKQYAAIPNPHSSENQPTLDIEHCEHYAKGKEETHDISLHESCHVENDAHHNLEYQDDHTRHESESMPETDHYPHLVHSNSVEPNDHIESHGGQDNNFHSGPLDDSQREPSHGTPHSDHQPSVQHHTYDEHLHDSNQQEHTDDIQHQPDDRPDSQPEVEDDIHSDNDTYSHSDDLETSLPHHQIFDPVEHEEASQVVHDDAQEHEPQAPSEVVLIEPQSQEPPKHNENSQLGQSPLPLQHHDLPEPQINSTEDHRFTKSPDVDMQVQADQQHIPEHKEMGVERQDHEFLQDEAPLLNNSNEHTSQIVDIGTSYQSVHIKTKPESNDCERPNHGTSSITSPSGHTGASNAALAAATAAVAAVAIVPTSAPATSTTNTHAFAVSDKGQVSSQRLSDANLISVPSVPSTHGRVKRSSERYHPTGEQLRILIEEFNRDPNPSAPKLKEICEKTNMPLANLVLWFKNRRARNKRSIPSVPKARRRSYVKSGIYSRNRAGPEALAVQKIYPGLNYRSCGLRPPYSGLELVPLSGPASLNENRISSERQAVSTGLYASTNEISSRNCEMALEGIGTRRLCPDVDSVYMQPVKRPRYLGLKEVIGEENPCRNWDSEKCHRICMDFFSKGTSGRIEQNKAAQVVCQKFFIDEVQNGLTLTSAMQPIETSVEVLDGIMNQDLGEGLNLSSGSRVLLREFLAQIRTGRAASLVLA